MSENSEKIKISRKLIIAIALVAVIAVSVVGSSVAYLMAQTSPLDNSFKPVYVKCEVVDDRTGGNVSIKNTGDINAYIRVTFIVNWVADDGTVHSSMPKLGEDYAVTLNGSNWYVGSDGFHYYALSVAPGNTTTPIIQTVKTLKDGPEGHKLSFHISATAIQSEPARAVESVWGVTIMSTGAIMPK